MDIHHQGLQLIIFGYIIICLIEDLHDVSDEIRDGVPQKKSVIPVELRNS